MKLPFGIPIPHFKKKPSGSQMECCALQCTADTLQAGLPNCWPQIAPVLREQSQNQKCELVAFFAEAPLQADIDINFARTIDDAVNQVTLAALQSNMELCAKEGVFLGIATLCLVAALFVVGRKLHQHGTHIDQPPLLA